MSRIICITGIFPKYDRRNVKIGEEFVVSHGIDEHTMRNVILPCEHPARLGAKFDSQLGEWVIEDNE